MRRRHIWHNGDWLDVTDMPRRPRVGPYIIRDGMDPAKHMANGQTYDSKSEFRRVTRAHGLIELGTDAPTIPAPRAPDTAGAREAVIEAYQMLQQGYTPPPVETASEALGDDFRLYT
jgi:hypothetical protein